MAKIRIENLTKRFGDQVAVSNLNLVVEDHSFTCLLGPSGCGKTTTLRMIAGLEFPDEGAIYFDDKRVDELSPNERNISMVFQFYAIYPNMSVYDEIAFPLKMMKRPEQEIRERVKRVAERVGIEGALNERASKMTVDKKQRIELARAIVSEPALFLFDEPLTNLDSSLRAEMRAEMSRIQKELRTTTIYVTHDQLEAMSLADKIAVMKDGQVLQYDSAEKVYEQPSNLFVAGFIGTPPMNFLDCVVGSKDTGKMLETAEFAVPVEAIRSIPDEYVGRRMVLGIRPEHISISDSRAQGVIRGKVELVEPLGHRLVVDVSVGSIALKVNSPYIEISVGQEIGLHIPEEHVTIFNPTSASTSNSEQFHAEGSI